MEEPTVRNQGSFVCVEEGAVFTDNLTLMLTDPSSLDNSPRRADSREDFPAPTGPTMASRQPWGTERLILCKQGGLSWVQVKVPWCTRMQVSPAGHPEGIESTAPGFTSSKQRKVARRSRDTRAWAVEWMVKGTNPWILLRMARMVRVTKAFSASMAFSSATSVWMANRTRAIRKMDAWKDTRDTEKRRPEVLRAASSRPRVCRIRSRKAASQPWDLSIRTLLIAELVSRARESFCLICSS